MSVIDNFWLSAERRHGCFDALLALRNMLDNRSENMLFFRWVTKKGLKAFRAILTVLIENIDLFMRYGDNIEIIVSQDHKNAKIKEAAE